MNLRKFFTTETGKHIMSAILGFGLASMFRIVCKERNCMIFKAPPLEEIDEKVFKEGNKCYTYKTKKITCKSKTPSVLA
jgi:hypothetical protein